MIGTDLTRFAGERNIHQAVKLQFSRLIVGFVPWQAHVVIAGDGEVVDELAVVDVGDRLEQGRFGTSTRLD